MCFASVAMVMIYFLACPDVLGSCDGDDLLPRLMCFAVVMVMIYFLALRRLRW
jgi:hypothetical protein